MSHTYGMDVHNAIFLLPYFVPTGRVEAFNFRQQRNQRTNKRIKRKNYIVSQPNSVYLPQFFVFDNLWRKVEG